jgi:spore germination protein YaaH
LPSLPLKFSRVASLAVLLPALLVPGVHASAPADMSSQPGASEGLALFLPPPPADESEPAVPQPEPAANQPHMLRWVYMTGTVLPEAVRQHPENIDVLSPAWYHLDGDGNIYGSGSAQVTRFAHEHGIKVMPIVANGEFDPDDAHDVFIDSHNQTRALDGLQWLVNNFGYDGINIDFENLYNADRNLFSGFMSNVYARIHREVGKTVTIALASKTREDYHGFAGPFDYAGLAPSFDYGVLMAYDQHYAGGEPGPVASLKWDEDVLKYVTQSIPASKLLLGLPFYGYNWNVTYGGWATPMSYNAIVKTVFAFGSGIQMDPASQTPSYTYQAPDGTHQIWFENSTSLGLKLQLAARYGLAGWGAWRGGMEDQNFWSLNLSPTAEQG